MSDGVWPTLDRAELERLEAYRDALLTRAEEAERDRDRLMERLHVAVENADRLRAERDATAEALFTVGVELDRRSARLAEAEKLLDRVQRAYGPFPDVGVFLDSAGTP